MDSEANRKRIADAVAEGFALYLSDYYREPVKRVSEYCDAFRLWHQVMKDKVKDLEENLDALDKNQVWDLEQAKKILDAMDTLVIPIYKSNFLARHVYGKEELRTEKCPEHKGVWSGCTWGEGACPYGCMSDTNVTGWLDQPHTYRQPPEDSEHIEYIQDRCYRCGGTKELGPHREKSDERI